MTRDHENIELMERIKMHFGKLDKDTQAQLLEMIKALKTPLKVAINEAEDYMIRKEKMVALILARENTRKM